MNKPDLPVRKTAFKNPDLLPDALPAGVLAGLVTAVGDVAIILSEDGVILDVAVSQGELSGHGFSSWVGSSWADTVTVESRPKIEQLLADAMNPGASPRWRQVNHAAAGGDVPVRYLVMELAGAKSGLGRLIAIGRDMRGAAAMQQRLLQTQQSLERDYIRLRQAEARYRLLFDTAGEAVLIVDTDTMRVQDANAVAHRLIGVSDETLSGKSVSTIASPDQRDRLMAMLGAARAADDVAPVTLRLAETPGEVRVSARLFRQTGAPLLIVRIAPVGADAQDEPTDAALRDVIERMPDAFVLTGRDLRILTANAAFLDLAEAPSLERAVGQPLGRWLGRPGIDLELIAGQLREHGSVRNVSTILRGSFGAHEEVELSGVAAPFDTSECYGFAIRNVARRLRLAPAPDELPRSVGQLTELVGRMSLKEIVRESTDMIERLCIEAALVYTADNRASAAEILGVSRQSLYSKLHRHGLGNLVSTDD